MAVASPQKFADLARIYSHGLNAKHGGKLGIFSAETRPKHFREHDLNLKAGSISKVIKAKSGYYIFKIDGKYKPGWLPPEALEKQLETTMIQERIKEEKLRLRQQLVTRAKQIIHPGPAWPSMGIDFKDLQEFLKSLPTRKRGRNHLTVI